MKQAAVSSSSRDDSHVHGANKLFLVVLWLLLATAVGLSFVHETLLLALAVGTPLALFPTILIVSVPDKLITRLAVAVALMLFCALHIHQMHGMTELHFGIFVLLAFLVCYQDWRVIIAAAATAAVHHLSFNYLQEWGYPAMCFTRPGIGMVLLHAVYVVIEAAVLGYVAVRLQRETTTVRHGADLLQETLRTMHESADKVAEGMHLIAQTSSAIACSSEDLSVKATTQAARLEQASNSIETLAITVKRNVEHTGQANELVSSASSMAIKGGEVVANVVQTMNSIQASSRKIEDIISVIDGIAFQTNILALNAAVEAARAGEQGRGFAVVASEVRNLAQRSSQAAKEVRQLINDSTSQVSAGGRLVDEAGHAMNDIVDSVGQVAQIMTAIAGASQEQRDGIEQMIETIQEIEQTTRQTVLLVEQSSVAVESMCEHASSAKRAVGALRHQDPVIRRALNDETPITSALLQ
ncbi:methyl-accepting chemotaxis protein [Massilia sp. LjRoot122]|uniref:methyl-accepting chemotaxis protein n=1 Tax=Massilia sp. LjRoot122 TaxID=3342257 RepID=UPI003ED0E70F